MPFDGEGPAGEESVAEGSEMMGPKRDWSSGPAETMDEINRPRVAVTTGGTTPKDVTSMPDSPYIACSTCGEQFLPHHRQQTYCSKPCQLDGSATKRDCPICGEAFLARQEHKGYARKFCSRACTAKYNHESRVAKYPAKEEIVRLYVEEGLSDREIGRKFGHSYQWSLGVRRHYGIPGKPKGSWNKKPLSKKSDRMRWAISMKREPVCRNCGLEAEVMHLHHAVPRSHNRAGKYDLRNGIPLCGTCHLGWHQMAVNIYRDRFAPEEWDFIVTLAGEEWLDRRYPVRPADGGTLKTNMCQRGHLLEGSNLMLAGKKRRCRQCANRRAAEYRNQKRAA